MKHTRYLSLAILVSAAAPWANACGGDDGPGGGGTQVGVHQQDAGKDAEVADAFVAKPFDPPPESKPIEEPKKDPDAPRPSRDAGAVRWTDDEDAGECDPDACAAVAAECLIGTCNEETGACEFSNADDGTACGESRDTACTDPDTCRAGTCEPNDAAEGSPCGDTGRECLRDDTCDGHGRCIDNGVDEGAACGDPNETDCDLPDICDRDGICRDNFVANGVACRTDIKKPVCGPADTCSGTGSCISQGIYRPISKGQTCPYGFPAGADRCYCDNEGINMCRPERTVCADDGLSCDFRAGKEPLAAGTACGSGMMCNEYGDCI